MCVAELALQLLKQSACMLTADHRWQTYTLKHLRKDVDQLVLYIYMEAIMSYFGGMLTCYKFVSPVIILNTFKLFALFESHFDSIDLTGWVTTFTALFPIMGSVFMIFLTVVSCTSSLVTFFFNVTLRKQSYQKCGSGTLLIFSNGHMTPRYCSWFEFVATSLLWNTLVHKISQQLEHCHVPAVY